MHRFYPKLVSSLLLSLIFCSLQAQTVIYSTNFGTSGTAFPSGWTTSGAQSANLTISNSSASSYTGAIISSSGSNNLADGAASSTAGTAIITASGVVATTGYTGIQLAFGYRGTSAYSGTVTLDYSTDGSSWTPVSLGTITNDGTWRISNGGSWISLPTNTENISNLRFRFTFVRTTGNSANFRIDDFNVRGTSSATPDIAISSAGHPAAANLVQGSTNTPIARYDLGVTTANATLTGVSLTTAGTYTASDIATNGFKFWYTTGTTFAATTQLGTGQAAVNSGGTIAVSGLSRSITSGTTGYVWVTADAAANATVGNTVGIAAPVPPAANFTFSAGNITSTYGVSNLFTIAACTPVTNTTLAASVGNTQSILTWTNAACQDEVMIVAATAANTASPTGDGTAYTGNTVYGSGTAIGNGFVVYKGSLATATVTGLTNGTAYRFKIFTRKGSTWVDGNEVSVTPALADATAVLWNATGGTSAWLTSGSWNPSGVPTGSQTARIANVVTSSGNYGINLNTTSSTNNGTSNQAVGAIELASNTTSVAVIGNSTTATDGTLTLTGVVVNGIANTILRNNSGFLLTIQNAVNTGNRSMAVALANTTNNIVQINSTGGITITSIITGANPLSRVGSGTGILQLTANNTYTGLTTVADGILQVNAASGNCLPAGNSVVVNSGGTFRVSSATQTLTNITVNTGGTLLVDAGDVLTITGTLTNNGTVTNNGTIIMASTTGSSAAQYLGTGAFTGNLTVQRFIPSKTTRKWNFLASPVAATVRNSWQQQTFITGSGTGGTPCGTGAGNGGANDRYNSNGFDATINNSATMFTYNGVNAVNGSRWEPITNTSFSLVPGRGYRINIRGTRGAADANCTNLINSGTPNAPDAVALAVTGPITSGVNTGTVTVTLDGGNNDFTLLGNPYPSTIDFDAFRATNATGLFDGFWLYSPQVATTNYTTVNGSTATNAPTGETATTLKKIASGQAFFVQNIGTSGQTVSFQESHKIAGTAGNFRTTQAASYNWENSMLRLGLQNSSLQLLDELVVRFGSDANISNTTITTLDAANISDFTTAIATLKNNRRIAIQTRSLPFVADTVQLEVRASAAGTYQLVASDFASFTAAESIVLVDAYTQTSTNLKLNNSYSFTVTTDPATVGTQRFYLVFRGAATLPVNFTNIFAKYQQANTVQVKWQVASESNIEKYRVEYSTNGSQFSTALELAATGNNGQAVNYTAEHSNQFTGITYYRVVAIAKNGAQRISAVVKVSKAAVEASVTVLSNPVQQDATLLLQGITKGATVRVSTASGKAVAQVVVPNQQNLVTLPVNHLVSGMYLVTVLTENGEILATKFVKQ